MDYYLNAWNNAQDYFSQFIDTEPIIENGFELVTNEKIKDIIVEDIITHDHVLNELLANKDPNQPITSKLSQLTEQVRKILLASPELVNSVLELPGLQLLDTSLLYILHFNYLYFRSTILEFIGNPSLQVSLLRRLCETNLKEILTTFCQLRKKGQLVVFIQGFEPSEMMMKRSFEFYLKLNTLIKELNDLCNFKQINNYEGNFLIALIFESQEIFQNLPQQTKKQLSDLQEKPTEIICEKQLQEILTLIERVTERMLLHTLDEIMEKQSALGDILLATNKLLFFDLIEQSIYGYPPKGSQTLLDLVDIGTCRGFINTYHTLTQNLKQMKNQQSGQVMTNVSKKIKVNSQMDLQIYKLITKIESFMNVVPVLFKMMEKRKKAIYGQTLNDLLHLKGKHM